MHTWLLLFISILSIHPANAKTEGKGIQFFKGTWEEVLAKAKKEQKYIFIEATATWCGPCRFMEKNIFPDETVGLFFNEVFIPYKLDIDEELGKKIHKKFKGNSVPTYYFIDGDGKLIYVETGSKRADEFIQVGKNALEMSKMNKKFQNGNRELAFMLKYANMTVDKDNKEIIKFVNNYFNNISCEELLIKENFELFEKFPSNPFSKGYECIINNYKEFSDKFGSQKMYIFSITKICWPRKKEICKNNDKQKLEEHILMYEKLVKFLPEGVTSAESYKKSCYEDFYHANKK